MARPHQIFATALLALLSPTGCDPDSRDYDPDSGEPIEVSEAQELDMCDNFGASTYKPVSAGADIDSCGAVDAQPGLKRIALAEINGGRGGLLRLSLQPENESPAFLMLDTELPFRVVREDDSEVHFLEEGLSSDLCDEARGRYLWIVDGSTNYLEFGPTAVESVDLVLEVVE
ncbi:MAG: hypothetical protein JRI55_10520 [Deltaproteobacteria bacterium]|jgi:hypothetical protein|nr:hypothetical protein [Deltaproteobacteria bacterium]